MENTQTKYRTGGSFLVEPINEAVVYSREDFTDEHREIYAMVKEFDKETILEKKEDIEKFDKELSLSLIKEMGELGLLGIDIPEEYGGMELDKVTSAIVAEALTYSPSYVVSSNRDRSTTNRLVWYTRTKRKIFTKNCYW